MAYSPQQQELPPKAIIYIFFALGLAALAYAIILQKLIIAAIIIALPFAAIIFVYGIQSPRLIFLLYAIVDYYLTAIMRYSDKEGLSVILDILLVSLFLAILLYAAKKNTSIYFPNAINTLTISYIVWILFVFIQFLNPRNNNPDIIMVLRGWVLSMPMVYIAASLLLDKPKILKNALIVLVIFTITAFVKLLLQKYWRFDAAEIEWLRTEAWQTHLLKSGIRYFSIFSDAGNFGSHMGMIAIVYSIVSCNTSQKILRFFYISIAIMGISGLFMSGTRGAIVVPMSGLALYCLISKNFKLMSISACIGISLFAFFAFTNIGDNNALIRRMRSAFKPTEDASFNVRIENQKKIAHFLESYPLGAGIGGRIMREVKEKGQIVEKATPPDSFYVDIWMQTGFWGLSLYIAINVIILLRCCYIIMFCIRNEKLKNILAALLCGVFGMWLNGYVGRGMTMHPSGFVIICFIAFILNGVYIDKQINNVSLVNNK